MDEKELARVHKFWAGRRTMTKAGFVSEFLPHPDIGQHCRAEICNFVFQNRDTVSSNQFVFALNVLKAVGWPCGVALDKLATASMPNISESNVTLNEIIAGVTHFEVEQIAWLERRFCEQCDRRSLSISETTFVSSVLSATKRLEVASRVFRLFSEHNNSAIGFKEYVCGLSSLCRGPEVERMKFAVGIWDLDMDGVLSRNDLTELAEYFCFSMDLLAPQFEEEQHRQMDTLHIFDFVCLASQSPTIREKLLQFSNKVWTALTTSSSSSPTITSSTATTPAASSVDEPPEEGENIAEDESDEKQSPRAITEEGNEQQRQRPGGRRRLGGVRNIGNTCYLGAAVQTLANVSLLSGFLISNEQQFLHLPLVLRYANMLRSLLVKKETASPVELKESVSERCTLFADDLQHDSQEFMQFFLDALHESLKSTPSTASSSVVVSPFRRVFPPPEGEEKRRENGQREDENDQQKKEGNAKDQLLLGDTNEADEGETVAHRNSVWQNAKRHWKKEVLNPGRGSIVLDLFAGQFLSMLRCPCCSHSSNTFELFTMLQLQIPVSDSLLIPFKVVRKCPTLPIVRFTLRVPATTKVWRVKQLISQRIGIGISNILVVILNRSDGKYNATFSKMLSGTISLEANGETDGHGNTLMEMPFINDMDICCFETDSAGHADNDGDSVHLICVHRQFHFKSSFAVLALDGIGTYTFGTPIVLTFPSNYKKTQKTVLAGQLYTMVLEYVQKRYQPNTERHLAKNGSGAKSVGGHPYQHHLFNRALDANADSSHQNAYPFALALTKSDATWCYKCDWRRFCRGCPIDANSTDSFALDELLAGQCLLTINWKNIAALHLLYNNLAERFIDDCHQQQASSAGAELLDDASPRISIDDCLTDFTRAERIDGSRCDRCSKRPSPMPLTKQLSFTQLPDILVICFKRFTFVPSLRQFVKQIVPVSFPLDNFDPSKYFSSDVPAELLTHFSRYFCIGIVTHHGQLDYGHYCSYVRDFFSDEWFFCNDNKTFPIKSSEVDTRNAYIVFYQRVTTTSADAHCLTK